MFAPQTLGVSIVPLTGSLQTYSSSPRLDDQNQKQENDMLEWNNGSQVVFFNRMQSFAEFEYSVLFLHPLFSIS